MRLVDVLPAQESRAFTGSFTYAWPDNLGEPLPGQRVIVPLGPRQTAGYVLGPGQTLPVGVTLREVEALDGPPPDPHGLELAKWLSERYLCPLSAALRLFQPPPVKRPRAGRRASPEVVGARRAVALNPAQERALASVEAAIAGAVPARFLLYGVTGSGKTEVYLRAMAAAARAGKQSLALVPEIALTGPFLEAVRGWFGDGAAILHSGLAAGERYDEWNRLARREATVAVGARSALGAPLPALGLVVVDEEHEPAYKQEEDPRYHARDLAEARARLAGAVLLLGTATPSLEANLRAQSGDFTLLSLPERVDGRPLPPVEIVDMRTELKAGNRTVLSGTLAQALRETIAGRHQAIIFLNRRGYATFVLCRECGHVEKCPRCDVSLTYHAAAGLKCHWCGHARRAPDLCPGCGSAKIRYFGSGTQRVEEAVRAAVPTARVARMDRDTVRRKGESYRLYRAMACGELDVLVGTQMVAKGLDLPGVTLVGVVSADTSLNIADFRAGERTFQLLEQVSGRCGRGEAPGRVIVQTYEPEHYSIASAAHHDYQAFAARELEYRKALGYPPFGRLVSLLVYAETAAAAAAGAAGLAEAATGCEGVTVLGPAPAALARLEGKHRWRVVLKGPLGPAVVECARRALAGWERPSGCALGVDVDPQQLT